MSFLLRVIVAIIPVTLNPAILPNRLINHIQRNEPTKAPIKIEEVNKP